MQHVMVDLETLSSTPGGVVVSIGAVAFDPESGVLGDRFKVNIDPETDPDGDISGSTVLWWLKQSKEAQESIQGGKPLVDALNEFTAWLTNTCGGSAKIWGNGATFDNVLLRAAYGRVGLKAPWSYRNDYCYRTIKNLNPDIKMAKRGGVAHDALDDAVNQALHLLEIVRGGEADEAPSRGGGEQWSAA